MKTKLFLLTLFIFLSQQIFSQAPNWAWAKSFGDTTGMHDVFCNSMAIDPSGNVYSIGHFAGVADFDPGPGTYNLTDLTAGDLFISKLDASGNFVWAKQFGFPGLVHGYAITVDHFGNVYSTGWFNLDVDFDPGPGIFQLSTSNLGAFFVLKLDASGNFIWAKEFDGTSTFFSLNNNSFAISTDTSGNVYSASSFQGTGDFDPGPGVFDLTSTGLNDIYISKLDSSGNFVWAKAMNGTSTSYCSSIALDSHGNAYTTGYFNGTVDFDPSASTYNLTSSDSFDIFISKLDASGNFIWAKKISGAGDDESHSIALDTHDNVYTTGWYNGTVDFDPGTGTYNLTAVTSFLYDMFILKLDSSGNFVWAKSIGGSSTIVYSYSLAIDNAGSVYSTGTFGGGNADFDPGPSTFNLYGQNDPFISKLDSSGNFVWAKIISGSNQDWSGTIGLNVFGNVYIAGNSDSPSITLDSLVLQNPNPGLMNVFIGKIQQTSENCLANYDIYPDTSQLHTYWIANNAIGIQPLHYLWNWGDSTYDTIPYPSHTYADSGYYTICLTISDTLGCSSTYCNNYYLARMNTTSTSMVYVNVINPITSIKNIEHNHAFSIFPNPATNHLTISLINNNKNLELSISDITGKIIYKNYSIGRETIEVDTKGFSEGVYVVRIKTPDSIETKKLIIEK